MLSREGNWIRLPLTDEGSDDSEEVLSPQVRSDLPVLRTDDTKKAYVHCRFDVPNLPRHQRFREVDLSVP